MGDAENSLPPSKKRAAGRELTRDTPLNDEEDTPELDSGTFERASDEVLATRRIVNVRHQQTNSASSSNPFAGIRMVGATESSANPGELATKTQSASENTNVIDSNKHAVEERNADREHAEEESNGNKSELDNVHSKVANKNENEDKKDAVDKESASEIDKEPSKEEINDEKDDKKENSENKYKEDKKLSEEPSAEGGTLNSFLQLSSSKNAFTGLAGTGFSSSLFSFGSISQDGSALGSGAGSIFGMKNGSSGFGTSGASVVSKGDGSGFSTLQEVVVETGEENEKVVFNADSILFEFVDESWKERGKGELKVNVNSGTEKARLLMRSRGNYRLILNAHLYPDMKLTDMDNKKGVTFACINSATEGKDGLSTFALKFKDGSLVEEFKAAITDHKGEASTVLKNPENSPKASDV